jgi:SAM-dependent methyltransferase
MKEGGHNPYDEVAYISETVPYASPGHIALCAHWSHGFPAVSEQFSVAELGCGDGGNLLPIAFYNPSCSFLGVDSSAQAVERARDAATALGLRNIQFLQRDVRGLRSTEDSPFDYIIAHGLYSWAAEDARRSILRFCGDALTADGLAYISYNAQPGWSTRQLVRHALRRSPEVRNAASSEQARKAIEVAARLLEDLPSPPFASAAVLADELMRVRRSEPHYVQHEYLADTNDGFWLSEFVEDANRNDLDYLVDAQFCKWEGYVSPDLRQKIHGRGFDRVEEEETLDLIGHRYFRASILCRSSAEDRRWQERDLSHGFHIAASLRVECDPLDLTEGVMQRFANTAGSEILLDSAITKAAAVVLSLNWPAGMKFDRLLDESTTILRGYDCALTPTARQQLQEDLTLLFETGQVDLRLREPVYDSTVGDRPKAHRLARWEADQRTSLTSPHHICIAVSNEGRAIIRAADGSRTTADLARLFGPQVVDQTLRVLARWGLLTQ